MDNAGAGGTGDLIVQPTNFQTPPGSDADLMNGISFTLSAATGTVPDHSFELQRR